MKKAIALLALLLAPLFLAGCGADESTAQMEELRAQVKSLKTAVDAANARIAQLEGASTTASKPAVVDSEAIQRESRAMVNQLVESKLASITDTLKASMAGMKAPEPNVDAIVEAVVKKVMEKMPDKLGAEADAIAAVAKMAVAEELNERLEDMKKEVIAEIQKIRDDERKAAARENAKRGAEGMVRMGAAQLGLDEDQQKKLVEALTDYFVARAEPEADNDKITEEFLTNVATFLNAEQTAAIKEMIERFGRFGGGPGANPGGRNPGGRNPGGRNPGGQQPAGE